MNATSDVVTGAPAVTTITGHSGGWTAASGDDESFVLVDAWAAILGVNADVTFQGAGSQVSFYGPPSGHYAETVHGSGGVVILNDPSVALTLTGDNDLVYFGGDDDILNLTAATAGAWSALYASGGVVNLAGASLSIVGGGVSVNAQTDDAVSLYQTNGVADSVSGDGVTVILNAAQANVFGDACSIWFEGGSGSTVTVDSAAGRPDTVYGAGTVELAGGEVLSIGGGALIDFLQQGGVADVSFTQGLWDRVQGAAGTTNIYNAQVVVSGGGQTVDFIGGDDSAATLTRTQGAWDNVYGSAPSLTLNSAQASVFGDISNIFLTGSGSAVSLYNAYYAYTTPNILGSDATVITNNVYAATVTGGGDHIFVTTTNYIWLTLAGTYGDWDVVQGDYMSVNLSGAQASVFGVGNSVYMNGGASAVSLYGTGGGSDSVYGTGALTLNDANAYCGGEQYVYFGGAANTLSLAGYNDVLSFAGAFGIDTINNFYSGVDSLQLSHAQFADMNAVRGAVSAQGDDAVLTLDATDKVVFTGVSVTSLLSASFTFV